MSDTLAPGNGDCSADGIETVSRCLFCDGDTIADTCDGARDFYFAADPGEFSYHRCAACGSLWLENRPTGERLLKAYSTYHTHAEPEPPTRKKGLRAALRSTYIRSRFVRPTGAIDQLLVGCAKAIIPDNFGINRQFRFAPPAPARVLDYGCGSGEYLLWLEPLGYTLYGAEYDPELLASVARRGIQIENVATVAQQPWDGTFDHITLAHVLEHVPDPIGLLARLFGWLKPGGTLFLELPNADATGLAIFGRYWRGLEAPRHFALPTQAALIGALEQAGFADVQQHIDPLVRGWMWEKSLSICPEEQRGALEAAMRASPPESAANAEFLTFVARKPG